MSQLFNFSAGPAMLPVDVLKQAQEELLNWNGQGVSVMEISHRDPVYVHMAREAEQDLRDLLNVPDDYEVLFLQGGGRGQFSAVPQNIFEKSARGRCEYCGARLKNLPAFCEIRPALGALLYITPRA